MYKKQHQSNESINVRKSFENTLRVNAAFQKLLERKANGSEVPALLKQGFNLVSTGQREFTLDHAKWIHKDRGKGLIYSLLDLHRSEDIFYRTDVSTEESLKVSGIPLHLSMNGIHRTEITKTKVGLYEISSTMEQWANNIGQRLHKIEQRPIPRSIVTQILAEDREWVNDDSGIIALASLETRNSVKQNSVALVSSDKHLAKRLSNTIGMTVLLIKPLDFLIKRVKGGYQINSTTRVELNWFLNNYPRTSIDTRKVTHIYVDTGSLAAAASQLEGRDERWGKEIFSRTNISTGILYDHRYTIFELQRLKAEDQRGVIKVITPIKPSSQKSGSRYYSSSESSSDNSSLYRDPTIGRGKLPIPVVMQERRFNV
jgi:hypothetical protein